MQFSEYTFYFLLPVIAFLYASVGHGGASGYLALMTFFSFSPQTMRSTALLLNLFVSLIAFIQYYRNGHFKWSLFWPFAITSFPAAFIGGLITINSDLYEKILAVFLLFSAIRFLGLKFESKSFEMLKQIPLALIIGAAIGLFSGMIGIGGGIILSPVILLLNWANMKQTAAVSALFIFVNSLAGIGGLVTNGFQPSGEIGIMVAIALCGGIAGSYFGAKKFNNAWLNKLLAIVLIVASAKLFLI